MSSTVRIEIEMDSRGAVLNTRQLGDEMRKLPQSTSVATAGVRQLREQQEKARDACDLLADRMGVVLPRELKKFIAETKTVGAVLSTAFNASIFLAFGAAGVSTIVDLCSKIPELVDKFADWSSGLSRTREEMKKSNEELGRYINSIKALRNETALIGLSGSAKIAKEATFSDESLRAAHVGVLKAKNEAAKIAKLRVNYQAFLDSGGAQTQNFTEFPSFIGLMTNPYDKKLEQATQATIDAQNQLRAIEDARTKTNKDLTQAIKEENNQEITRLSLKRLQQVKTELAVREDLLAQMGKIGEGLPRYTPTLPQFTAPGNALADVERIAREQVKGGAISDYAERADAVLKSMRSITEVEDRAFATSWSAAQDQRMRDIERLREGAGHIFDSLLSGSRYAFRDIIRIFEGVFLTPVRMAFQNLAVRMFSPGGGGGGIGPVSAATGAMFSMAGPSFGGSSWGGGGGNPYVGLSSLGGISYPDLSGVSADLSGIGSTGAGAIHRGLFSTLTTNPVALGLEGMGGMMLAQYGMSRGSPALGGIGGFFAGGAAGYALAPYLAGHGMFLAGSLAGPIGAGVGALVGILLASRARGQQKRSSAAVHEEYLAAQKQILTAYEQHKTQYDSAVGSLSSAYQTAVNALQGMGGPGATTISEITTPYKQTLQRMQSIQNSRDFRTGAIGGLPIPTFASGSAGIIRAGDGFLSVLHPNEAVLNERAAAKLGDATIRNLNRGGATSGDAGGAVNIYVLTPDVKTTSDWLQRSKRPFVQFIRRAAIDAGRTPPF